MSDSDADTTSLPPPPPPLPHANSPQPHGSKAKRSPLEGKIHLPFRRPSTRSGTSQASGFSSGRSSLPVNHPSNNSSPVLLTRSNRWNQSSEPTTPPITDTSDPIFGARRRRWRPWLIGILTITALILAAIFGFYLAGQRLLFLKHINEHHHLHHENTTITNASLSTNPDSEERADIVSTTQWSEDREKTDNSNQTETSNQGGVPGKNEDGSTGNEPASTESIMSIRKLPSPEMEVNLLRALMEGNHQSINQLKRATPGHELTKEEIDELIARGGPIPDQSIHSSEEEEESAQSEDEENNPTNAEPIAPLSTQGEIPSEQGLPPAEGPENLPEEASSEPPEPALVPAVETQDNPLEGVLPDTAEPPPPSPDVPVNPTTGVSSEPAAEVPEVPESPSAELEPEPVAPEEQPVLVSSSEISPNSVLETEHVPEKPDEGAPTPLDVPKSLTDEMIPQPTLSGEEPFEVTPFESQENFSEGLAPQPAEVPLPTAVPDMLPRETSQHEIPEVVPEEDENRGYPTEGLLTEPGGPTLSDVVPPSDVPIEKVVLEPNVPENHPEDVLQPSPVIPENSLEDSFPKPATVPDEEIVDNPTEFKEQERTDIQHPIEDGINPTSDGYTPRADVVPETPAEGIQEIPAGGITEAVSAMQEYPVDGMPQPNENIQRRAGQFQKYSPEDISQQLVDLQGFPDGNFPDQSDEEQEQPNGDIPQQPVELQELPVRDFHEKPVEVQESPTGVVPELPDELQEYPVGDFSERPFELQEFSAGDYREQPVELQKFTSGDIPEQPVEVQEFSAGDIPEQSVEMQEFPASDIQEQPVEVQEFPAEDFTEQPVEVQQFPAREFPEHPVEVEEFPAEDVPEQPVELQEYPVGDIPQQPVEKQEFFAGNIPEQPVEVQEFPAGDNPQQPVELQEFTGRVFPEQPIEGQKYSVGDIQEQPVEVHGETPETLVVPLDNPEILTGDSRIYQLENSEGIPSNFWEPEPEIIEVNPAEEIPSHPSGLASSYLTGELHGPSIIPKELFEVTPVYTPKVVPPYGVETPPELLEDNVVYQTDEVGEPTDFLMAPENKFAFYPVEQPKRILEESATPYSGELHAEDIAPANYPESDGVSPPLLFPVEEPVWPVENESYLPPGFVPDIDAWNFPEGPLPVGDSQELNANVLTSGEESLEEPVNEEIQKNKVFPEQLGVEAANLESFEGPSPFSEETEFNKVEKTVPFQPVDGKLSGEFDGNLDEDNELKTAGQRRSASYRNIQPVDRVGPAVKEVPLSLFPSRLLSKFDVHEGLPVLLPHEGLHNQIPTSVPSSLFVPEGTIATPAVILETLPEVLRQFLKTPGVSSPVTSIPVQNTPDPLVEPLETPFANQAVQVAPHPNFRLYPVNHLSQPPFPRTEITLIHPNTGPFIPRQLPRYPAHPVPKLSQQWPSTENLQQQLRHYPSHPTRSANTPISSTSQRQQAPSQLSQPVHPSHPISKQSVTPNQIPHLVNIPVHYVPRHLNPNQIPHSVNPSQQIPHSVNSSQTILHLVNTPQQIHQSLNFAQPNLRLVNTPRQMFHSISSPPQVPANSPRQIARLVNPSQHLLSHSVNPHQQISHLANPSQQTSHQINPSHQIPRRVNPSNHLSHSVNPFQQISHPANSFQETSHPENPSHQTSHPANPFQEASHQVNPSHQILRFVNPPHHLSHSIIPSQQISHPANPSQLTSHQVNPPHISKLPSNQNTTLIKHSQEILSRVNPYRVRNQPSRRVPTNYRNRLLHQANQIQLYPYRRPFLSPVNHPQDFSSITNVRPRLYHQNPNPPEASPKQPVLQNTPKTQSVLPHSGNKEQVPLKNQPSVRTEPVHQHLSTMNLTNFNISHPISSPNLTPKHENLVASMPGKTPQSSSQKLQHASEAPQSSPPLQMKTPPPPENIILANSPKIAPRTEKLASYPVVTNSVTSDPRNKIPVTNVPLRSLTQPWFVRHPAPSQVHNVTGPHEPVTYTAGLPSVPETLQTQSHLSQNSPQPLAEVKTFPIPTKPISNVNVVPKKGASQSYAKPSHLFPAPYVPLPSEKFPPIVALRELPTPAPKVSKSAPSKSELSRPAKIETVYPPEKLDHHVPLKYLSQPFNEPSPLHYVVHPVGSIQGANLPSPLSSPSQYIPLFLTKRQNPLKTVEDPTSPIVAVDSKITPYPVQHTAERLKSERPVSKEVIPKPIEIPNYPSHKDIKTTPVQPVESISKSSPVKVPSEKILKETPVTSVASKPSQIISKPVEPVRKSTFAEYLAAPYPWGEVPSGLLSSNVQGVPIPQAFLDRHTKPTISSTPLVTYLNPPHFVPNFLQSIPYTWVRPSDLGATLSVAENKQWPGAYTLSKSQ